MINKPLNKCCLLLFGVSLFFSCSSARQQTTEEDWAQLEELVDEQNFEVTHEWMTPQRGRRVQLFNNHNFIRVFEDSVSIDLPYFGIRRMGGGFDNEVGIEYEGRANQFSVTPNKKKGHIEISFEADENSEIFDVSLYIYPNKTVHTTIISTERDNIDYQGTIQKFTNEE